jgi:hypothetical protein
MSLYLKDLRWQNLRCILSPKLLYHLSKQQTVPFNRLLSECKLEPDENGGFRGAPVELSIRT